MTNVNDGEGHKRFTVGSMAYLRNLDDEDLDAECFAVHFQAPPKDLGDGRKALGFIYPTLIVTSYIANQREIAEKIATILNEHWDEVDA